MPHLPHLISDLALILGAAGLTTLLFRWLRQPVVLGYILCGLLVGPNFKLFPTVADTEAIKVWAEIGVIILLFALGLEFSFKKLAKVGTSAGVTGLLEISSMMAIGFGIAQALGWPFMDSLFLGGIIAISSTTIIFRAFEELGIKTRQFTSLVLGVLIVEDLVAVVLMVLLSTLAISKAFAGSAMLLALGKLLFFLSLWFLLGIFLLPTLLRKAAKWLSSEMLLIGSLGLCLGMVVLAAQAGFSAALGAFVMGSILSETDYADRIEHLIAPIKNLFGAVFFVSVGMLIDPVLLWQYAGPVLLITLAVMGGKLLFVSLGALLAGRPLKQAVEAGTSMTQIGEFSFIIAALGVSLQVTSAYLYPIAVGVSVITTFTTPFMMRLAGPLHHMLVRLIPAGWQAWLDRYSAGSQVIKSESDWKKLMGGMVQLLVVNAVLMTGVVLLSRYYLKPWMQSHIAPMWLAHALALALSLAAMMPFVWAMMAKKIQGNAYKALWLDSKYNHGPLVTVEVVRNVLAVFFVGLLMRQYFSFWVSAAATLSVLAVVLVIFRQRLQQFYQRLEKRFLHNLHAREKSAGTPVLLAPWDAHLSRIRISPASPFIGQSLESLALREQFGINIAFIERGNRLIYAPSRQEVLYPYDELGVIGTDVQLQKFTVLVESQANEVPIADVLADDIVLQKIVVDVHSGLSGQTIRQSGIREQTQGLVVGIERQGQRLLNPSSDTLFAWEDVVWLVGDRKRIARRFFASPAGGA